MPINDSIIEQRFSELFTLVRELDKRTALSGSELGHLTKAIGDLKEDFIGHDEAEMKKFDKVEKKFEQIDEALKRFEKIIWTLGGIFIALQFDVQHFILKLIGG